MAIVGYFHICAINNYHSIVQDQIHAIKRSGLFDATDHINVVILSPNNEFIPEIDDSKFRIRYQSTNLNLYERITLNIMRQDCLEAQKNNQTNYIWYIHTKGVSSKNQNPTRQRDVRNWRKSMEAVVICNWEACVRKLSLENYDTCGINYTNRISNKYHYSGNFWWAQSAYIVRLPELQLIQYRSQDQYLEPEMWIGLKNPRAFSFFTPGSGYTIPDLTKLGLKLVPSQ